MSRSGNTPPNAGEIEARDRALVRRMERVLRLVQAAGADAGVVVVARVWRNGGPEHEMFVAGAPHEDRPFIIGLLEQAVDCARTGPAERTREPS